VIKILIYLGLLFATGLSFIFGLFIPALYNKPYPQLLNHLLGVSWCFLFFLAIVAIDRIAYYLFLPKHERGDFWHIKKISFGKRRDIFKEFAEEAAKAREEENAKLEKKVASKIRKIFGIQ
jgi:hypothetical protein